MKHLRRKIHLMAVLLAVLLLTGANAFTDEQEDLSVISVVAGMKKALKLTDAQVRQVNSVVRAYYQHVKELKADGASGETLQRKIRSLREEMDADLAHYLTEEQLSIWTKPPTKSRDTNNRTVAGRSTHGSADNPNPNTEPAPIKNDSGVLESGGTKQTNSTIVW